MSNTALQNRVKRIRIYCKIAVKFVQFKNRILPLFSLRETVFSAPESDPGSP